MKSELVSTAAQILETWGMFLVDRSEDSLQIFETNSPFYLAELQFNGEFSGTYQVVAQRNFVDSLVSNLLGLEKEAVDEKTVNDALSELVNVLSGNLLTSQFGDDLVFALTTPEVKKVSFDEVSKIFQKNHFCYKADDEPIVIACDIDSSF